MLYNPRDASDLRRCLRRIGDFTTRTVEDEVAFVRDELGAIRTIAELWVEAEPIKLSNNDGQGHLNHFNGQRKTAKMIDQLTRVGDNDKLPRSARDDLLAQQRAAAAFDESEAGAYFIGAIDSQVKHRGVVEGDDGNGERLSALPAGGRGRDAAHAQSLLYALAELLYEHSRGTAAAKSQQHSVLDKLQSPPSRHPLCFVLCHGLPVAFQKAIYFLTSFSAWTSFFACSTTCATLMPSLSSAMAPAAEAPKRSSPMTPP